MVTGQGILILPKEVFERTLTRLAHEIRENNPGIGVCLFAGETSRDYSIAQRLKRKIGEVTGIDPPLYWKGDLPEDMAEKVLVAVFHTIENGWDVFRSFHAILHLEHPPKAVQLAVLFNIMRWTGKDFPFRLRYVGKNVSW